MLKKYHTHNSSSQSENQREQLTILDGYDFSDVPASMDIKSLVEKTRLDFHKTYPDAPVALKINGRHFASLGNFSLIIGKAKSRKTFLCTLAMSAALSDQYRENAFKGYLPSNKKRVVFIDTEQGRSDAQKVAKRVMKLSQIETLDNFDVHTLRACSIEERLQVIEHIIYNTEDLGLLVIDGIRDLGCSINDEKEASFIANKLLKWTEERQIHIITVLHQNKGDSNARGHLGTELQNKAEATISVRLNKTKEFSIVKAEYCRQEEFKSFAFFINEDGLPQHLEDYVPTSNVGKKNSKILPETIEDGVHHKILLEVMGSVGDKKPRYSEFCNVIKDTAASYDLKFGESKAKSFLKYYMDKGWVTKVGKSKAIHTYYQINPTVINPANSTGLNEFAQFNQPSKKTA